MFEYIYSLISFKNINEQFYSVFKFVKKNKHLLFLCYKNLSFLNVETFKFLNKFNDTMYVSNKCS